MNTRQSLGIDELIAVGTTGAVIARAAQKAGLKKSHSVDGTRGGCRTARNTVSPGDLILVKGSRSARMEKVLEAFAKGNQPRGCTP